MQHERKRSQSKRKSLAGPPFKGMSPLRRVFLGKRRLASLSTGDVGRPVLDPSVGSRGSVCSLRAACKEGSRASMCWEVKSGQWIRDLHKQEENQDFLAENRMSYSSEGVLILLLAGSQNDGLGAQGKVWDDHVCSGKSCLTRGV